MLYVKHETLAAWITVAGVILSDTVNWWDMIMMHVINVVDDI